jgi:hypothetical protein
VEVAKLLIQQGANLLATDDSGFTPVRDSEQIKERPPKKPALKKNGVTLTHALSSSPLLKLHAAAVEGATGVTEFLLEAASRQNPPVTEDLVTVSWKRR